LIFLPIKKIFINGAENQKYIKLIFIIGIDLGTKDTLLHIYMTSDVTFKNQNYSSTSTNRIIVGTGSPFGDEFILRAGVAILI